MNRAKVVEICEAQVLGQAARLVGAKQDGLSKFADYEGCANLVYEYERAGRSLILRISFRSERPVEQIQAELHFINYLADNGARVSRPLPSQNGNLIETIQADGIPFIVVSFVEGRGMRVPDNEYRYREGVSIEGVVLRYETP